MMTNLKAKCLSSRCKTILATAVASTLINGVAFAADTVVVGNVSGATWGEDNFTINPNVVVGNSNAAFGIRTSISGTAGTAGIALNHGTITAQQYGFHIFNYSVTALKNEVLGSILSLETAVYNQLGNVGRLTNSGLIEGGITGIHNEDGSIGHLINNDTGAIYGASYAINNGSGSQIGAITNSGLIQGGVAAISNSGVLGVITNSGTIAGNVSNSTSGDLLINGATGSTFGVLTGSSAGLGAADVGHIDNAQSNVVFGAGNQLLNDSINVGTNRVSNLGTLQVNNRITITGNYSQDAAASLILGVTSKTDYGNLLVSGSATVASGSTVGLTQLGSYGFAQGQRYTVIQANSSGTDYNADSLKYEVPGYTATGESVVDGAVKALVLTVGPAGTSSGGPINLATTHDAILVSNGLFRYRGLNADLMNTFNALAAIGSSAGANSAGAQLSPMATLSAATKVSIDATAKVHGVTALHQEELRNESTGVSTGEGPATSGTWGQVFGGTSRMNERDDIAGYDARYSGLVLGADGLVNDRWRAGGLFSYTKATADNTGSNIGSSADVKSYGLFAYASYMADPWYIDLSAGAVQHQYDTQREIHFTGVSGTSKGSHHGMQYTAAAQTGYPIDLGSSLANVILTPIAGVSYSTLRQDRYTEKGNAGTTLHVDASDLFSLKSALGAKLERTFATPYGSLMPSVQLTWRHEFRDSALQSVANFSNDIAGSTSFNSVGPKAAQDTGMLSVGLTLVNRNNLTVSMHYTGEFGGGFKANTGDLHVRWAF